MGVFVPPVRPVAPELDVDEGFSIQSLRSDAEDWASERSWIPRLPLTIYLCYALLQHVRDPVYGSFLFGWVTVLIHELGHVVLGFGPTFLMAAGGTLAQIAAPLAIMAGFLKQRDYFGMTVAGFWLSFSFFSMSTYIADAREIALDYVTVGSGEGIHDWDYMLTELGILEFDKLLGGLVWLLALATGLCAMAASFWILYKMMKKSPQVGNGFRV